LHGAQPLLELAPRGWHEIDPKGLLAGQHLVQHAAQGIDVGSLVQALPTPLLRGHIRRRAGDPLPAHNALPSIRLDGVCVQFQAGLLDDLGQAKVGHLGQSPLGDENVLWFQVAVHQAGLLLLGVDQAPADVDGEIQRRPQVKRPAPQPTEQVGAASLFPSDPLQEHEGLVVKGVHEKAAHDVGVLFQCHPGCDFSLKCHPKPLAIAQVTLPPISARWRFAAARPAAVQRRVSVPAAPVGRWLARQRR
jgi:hypothetical protein